MTENEFNLDKITKQHKRVMTQRLSVKNKEEKPLNFKKVDQNRTISIRSKKFDSRASSLQVRFRESKKINERR